MSRHTAVEPPLIGELPTLKDSEQLSFACGPERSCFNQCCHDLDLLLGPYDVLRLRRRLELSSGTFIQRYTRPAPLPPYGFPMVQLTMIEPARACPFVTDEGCSVYEDRPAACRIYPLGRGTEVTPGTEVKERYILIDEPFCKGHDDRGSVWTAASWVKDQQLEIYNELADRYAVLSSRWSAREAQLSGNQQNRIFEALFQLERFRDTMSGQTAVFEKLGLAGEQEAILNDETRLLRLAFDWITYALRV